MSVVIKSNAKAINSIRGYGSLSVPTKATLAMDFSNEKYSDPLGDITLSSVLTTSSESAQPVVDSTGKPSSVPTNTARISFNRNLTSKGLLMESGNFTNIPNPWNPESGTYTLRTVQYGTLYMVRVLGSGKADVTGENVLNKSGLGTENSPLVFKMGSGSKNVVLTITGTLKYCNIEGINQVATDGSLFYPDHSPLGRSYYQSVLSIANYIKTPAWAVAFTFTSNKVFKEQTLSALGSAISSMPLMRIGADNDHQISIDRIITTEFEADKLRIRFYNVITKLEVGYMDTPLTKGEHIKVAFSQHANGDSYVAINGVALGKVNYLPNNIPKEINIGDSNWVTPTLLSRAEGVFEKVDFYDTSLTAEQLEVLTGSAVRI